MYCGNCGAELGPEERFCGECGAPRPELPPSVEAAPAPPPTRKGRPWKRIALGCVGLLVVAGVGVLAVPRLLPFVSTAVQPTAVAEVAPTAMPTATLLPSATPTPTPGFSIRPYDPERDADAESVLRRVPDWEGAEQPGHYQWEVAFPADTPALISMGWCAADKQTLDANWSHMQYELTIDGFSVDLTQLAETERVDEDGACRFYSAVLAEWSLGRHSYVWVRHIYQTVSDGWDAYQAGDYVMEFIVDVVEGLIFYDDFNDNSAGWPEGEALLCKMWVENGEYHVLLKTDNWETPRTPGYAGDWVYSDVIVEAAARMVNDKPGYYGVSCRVDEVLLTYYHFSVFTPPFLEEGGYFAIGKRLEDEWVDIVPWTFSADINPGQEENVLRLDCVGDTIIASVNDQLLSRVTDDSLVRGAAGLMVGALEESGVHVAFDWVVIEPIE